MRALSVAPIASSLSKVRAICGVLQGEKLTSRVPARYDPLLEDAVANSRVSPLGKPHRARTGHSQDSQRRDLGKANGVSSSTRLRNQATSLRRCSFSRCSIRITSFGSSAFPAPSRVGFAGLLSSSSITSREACRRGFPSVFRIASRRWSIARASPLKINSLFGPLVRYGSRAPLRASIRR